MGRNVGRLGNGLGCVPDRIYRGVSDWEDGVMRYRICKNEAPHVEDYWTVEYETVTPSTPATGWWIFRKPGKPETASWESVSQRAPKDTYSYWPFRTRTFETEEKAQAYINEAKRPRTHVCGEPQ